MAPLGRQERDLSRYGEELLVRLLRQMLLIRRFEERSAQLYGLRKIGGFCHLYIGQEAVAVGSIATLDMTRDYVLTAYRDHGHALAVGVEPRRVMAELLGKEAGCSGGKGGSMHLFDADLHLYGGHGIVGNHIPLATGVALKIKYCGEDGVVICYFGDGAIHQGAFHEALNLARIWSLPIVYICENNQYGMGTDFRRVSSEEDFSAMGASYGIPGVDVDGMDVLSMIDAVSAAVARAREEGVPTLLDAKTYRYKGHSMTDPGKYRTREEIEAYRQQDPILILKAEMSAAGMLDEEAYARTEEAVQAEIQDAVEYAESCAEPPMEALYEDVLVDT